MKDKIIKILIFMITIINIICIGCSVFADLKGYLYDEYSTPSSIYIVIIAIILLTAHIFNIIVLKQMNKKTVNNNKKILLVLILIIASVFIPIKEKKNEWYDYSKRSNSNGFFTMPRTSTVEYKNLYGITLKKISDTTMSAGPDIY